tara:strand:+ start:8861 stop:9136 length:276 start_codon:yes stop_codon:yes gene_type:complete
MEESNPLPADGKCQRCECKTSFFTMSWFNTEHICQSCNNQEELHPDFNFAKDVELAYVKRGNYNYPGVGYPGKDGRLSEEFKQALIEELGL